ncbi:antibiotic biosynthesis monooxygenase [Kocuria arenosa]|uniref:antibiotic biosynthesis monooxygenase n=1 Tax=Kocuria arenosa TaxID=3071446 RepID=UPI0034D795C8
MSAAVVTTTDTTIEPEREQDLIEGFRRMVAGPRPDGLVRSELLRGQGGAWRIQTTWRDRDALMALRAAGELPAALALLDRLGAPHSHSVHTMEESVEA